MAFNVKKYLEGYKHKLKDESIALYGAMKIHIDGEYPFELIDKRRPSEPEHIKAYRKIIFQHVAEPTVNKVIVSLGRIRKSHDYDIKFVAEKQPARIREGEGLQDYLTKKFPYFGSLTNWTFTVLLKQLCMDANAICIVMPSEKEWQFNTDTYIKPYPYIFNSDQVEDFVEGEFVVVKSSDTSTYKLGDVTYRDGTVYYYADRNVIERWEKRDNGKVELVGEYKHNSGKLPAWKIGGLVKKAQDADFLMESRLKKMLPGLNEACREYSDLQAGVVQHLYLESWEIAGTQCPACKGIGMIDTEEGAIKCKNRKCKDGLLMNSPYETTKIKPGKVGEHPTPIPPKGIIEKNPEIIKVQDARVDAHCYKALAAVNMEFLAETPLNQSGRAKEVDRDEVNNFITSNAEDIVRNMDNVVLHTTDQRYSVIVPNPKERMEMMPTIPVPEKFDVISSNLLIEGIKQMREGKINPLLIIEAEKVFAGKEFNSDPKVRSRLELILSLDPLAGRTEDDKMMMVTNGGVTKEKYILSCNIIDFVGRALQENPNFEKAPRKLQLEILNKYAKEVAAELSAMAEVTKIEEEEVPPK